MNSNSSIFRMSVWTLAFQFLAHNIFTAAIKYERISLFELGNVLKRRFSGGQVRIRTKFALDQELLQCAEHGQCLKKFKRIAIRFADRKVVLDRVGFVVSEICPLLSRQKSRRSTFSLTRLLRKPVWMPASSFDFLQFATKMRSFLGSFSFDFDHALMR